MCFLDAKPQSMVGESKTPKSNHIMELVYDYSSAVGTILRAVLPCGVIAACTVVVV